MYANRSTFRRCAFGLVLVSAITLCHAQTLIIPQVADGGGWRTTLVLINTSATTASANLNFYMELTGGATQAWNPPFVDASSTQNLSLPGGGTLFLHTAGTNSDTSSGWGQLQASAGVVAYAVFTWSPGGTSQDGTAPAMASASRILVPFDNTAGLVTAIAVVNPTSASESVSAAVEFADGSTSPAALPAIPAQGHIQFLFPSQFPQTAGKSGLMEFYVSSGSLASIALRANGAALTTSPVYAETGPPIITVQTAVAQVQSVTLSATSASGAQSIQGTVLLTAAAPAGGAVVSLSSSSTAATVPAIVNIPAGATSATFTVTTSAVSSTQTATITATYLGNSVTTTLSLVPPTSSSWFSNLTCAVEFQPVGYPSGSGTISVDPDPGSATFSALAFAVGAETEINLAFSNGAGTNSGNTLTFNTLSAPGAFYSGSTNLSVSNGSLSLTLTQTSSKATYTSGTVTGTFSLTGTPAGGAAVTVAGSVTGTYYATLP